MLSTTDDFLFHNPAQEGYIRGIKARALFQLKKFPEGNPIMDSITNDE